jgi:hypothetical protein
MSTDVTRDVRPTDHGPDVLTLWTRALLGFVVVLSAIAVATLVVVWWPLRSVEADTLRFEVGKAILQVGFVAAVGAAATLVLGHYQWMRDRADRKAENRRRVDKARHELLRDLLRRGSEAYIDVKRARRLLRAHALTSAADGAFVRRRSYEELLLAINQDQLAIEQLADDVATAQTLLGTEAAGLFQAQFTIIEKRLGGLVTEFERYRRSLPEDQQRDDDETLIPLSALPAVGWFTREKTAGIGAEANVSFDDISTAMREARRLTYQELSRVSWPSP